ncbi:MAG: MGMT family protein [Actinobacteria bacterium]|nr:MGMT family protein [Actinomycetota bacterium]
MTPPHARHPRDFESRVTQVLARIDAGEVLTYGEVAAEAGHPGAARAVGNVLARGDGLPWWRVVTSTGRLVPGHEEEHARRLAREGVEVSYGRVRLNARADMELATRIAASIAEG